MAQEGWHPATARSLRSRCSFQADVARLPRRFDGGFDLVYSCLAHHHYPDPAAAAASVFRCLRPGGVYCVIDPGPAWFNPPAHRSGGSPIRVGWVGRRRRSSERSSRPPGSRAPAGSRSSPASGSRSARSAPVFHLLDCLAGPGPWKACVAGSANGWTRIARGADCLLVVGVCKPLVKQPLACLVSQCCTDCVTFGEPSRDRSGVVERGQSLQKVE
jgi:Methyltransferase domain